MAAAYCSVINGGSYYEPRVVKQILNEQGAVVKKTEPVLVRETVSESTTRFINEALYKTVNAEGGTGGAARVEGYKIAGKTGTAETWSEDKTKRDKENYVVSFCGYAPSDNPQVLVYVVVDRPHVDSQAHSYYASGIFQKIMKDTLPYLNIFPDTDINSPLPSEGAQKLPEQEGITSETQSNTEGGTAAEESKAEETTGAVPAAENGEPAPGENVNPSDEYVETLEGEEDFNLPGSLPGNPNPDQEPKPEEPSAQ
jgi:stage V sporulation protein D (sporulation-specific penicillin-binding protein)